MNKYAVIVAGGSGLRMGTELPKQFLLLHNKPILWHSIQAFFNAFDDIKIKLVLPKNHFEKGEEIKTSFDKKANNIELIEGGSTRFESVKNGLQSLESDGVVFVHDAVRCLITKELITTCFETCLLKGNAIPAVAATDSLRVIDADNNKAIDRNTIQIIQTPQTFFTKDLQLAFNQNFKETFTDEATVVEHLGQKIYLCFGDYNNIKITRPQDLIIAEEILKNRPAN